ncbi:MAG: hypothetical protein L6R38_000544 [Xanthoria sp. 2 TBL-2021]|nr:MAG: hypothetical protein L6R38_000544 [Xanthoria sp. 2 TBL-2021]
MGLGLLKKNASYCSVDPSIIFHSDPVLGEELIQAVDSYYRHGLVGPIDRITAPDVLRPERFLQHDRQLVASSEHPENLLLVSSGPMVKFDPDSSYVVTGALRGLGQSLIRWMDDRGTSYLALLSRRNISTVAEVQKQIESLARDDIHIENVIKKEQVMRVV